MTRLEYLTLRVLTSYTGQEAPEEAIQFYKAAGWDEEALDHYRARFGDFGKAVYPLPDSFRALGDAQRLLIGGREWIVVVGSGHSPEHALLYCPAAKLLISGDQVLPEISSNVSVQPLEPEADPLTDWLTTLQAIRARVPDDVLVLPSHGKPFRGLHARIELLSKGMKPAWKNCVPSSRHPKERSTFSRLCSNERYTRDFWVSLQGRAWPISHACELAGSRPEKPTAQAFGGGAHNILCVRPEGRGNGHSAPTAPDQAQTAAQRQRQRISIPAPARRDG